MTCSSACSQKFPVAVSRGSAHLMNEEGGIVGGLHKLVTGAGVPTKDYLPAGLPFQHCCIGMRTVHHQHRLQCLQAQLSLHSCYCCPVLRAHLACTSQCTSAVLRLYLCEGAAHCMTCQVVDAKCPVWAAGHKGPVCGRTNAKIAPRVLRAILADRASKCLVHGQLRPRMASRSDHAGAHRPDINDPTSCPFAERLQHIVARPVQLTLAAQQEQKRYCDASHQHV